ncbi:MT-A70 family protein [Marine Group I thaumarchaeote SCGC AAA799-E16]|uniref:MT-A70 family protein n=1 Tax=Marine Group I thaumarchaeote SCGC AAA799-E16 TaxID=1502292 RepID=A0A081S3S6_9ARCH|nr:MT-A70 family protein [Marine Group I thaumarchaeote SCGC AAA799-E16]
MASPKLKESIKKDGQWTPITINQDGVILDGHHRYRICNELSITPKTITKTFQNKLLEEKFVIESNLLRRHLNDFQRAELGIPLLSIEKKLAKERQLSTLKKGTSVKINWSIH